MVSVKSLVVLGGVLGLLPSALSALSDSIIVPAVSFIPQPHCILTTKTYSTVITTVITTVLTSTIRPPCPTVTIRKPFPTCPITNKRVFCPPQEDHVCLDEEVITTTTTVGCGGVCCPRVTPTIKLCPPGGCPNPCPPVVVTKTVGCL